ncbi:hypothetical protein V1522DRAFT_453385 [Lipomyces starkeyi]
MALRQADNYSIVASWDNINRCRYVKRARIKSDNRLSPRPRTDGWIQRGLLVELTLPSRSSEERYGAAWAYKSPEVAVGISPDKVPLTRSNARQRAVETIFSTGIDHYTSSSLHGRVQHCVSLPADPTGTAFGLLRAGSRAMGAAQPVTLCVGFTTSLCLYDMDALRKSYWDEVGAVSRFRRRSLSSRPHGAAVPRVEAAGTVAVWLDGFVTNRSR